MKEATRFGLIYLSYFAALSGFGTFRNVYLEDVGMTGFEMGVLGAIVTVVAVVAQPIWGFITDRRGIQREVLLVCGSVTAFAVLVYPAAPYFDAVFAVLVLGTVVYAAFHAPIAPITDSLVLSTSVFYGRARAFGSLAFGGASLVYGYLITGYGTSLIFYAYSLGMIALVSVAWTLPSRDDGGFDVVGREAVDLVRDRDYVLLLLSGFLVGTTLLSGNDFFSVYVRAIGGTDFTTGVAWFLLTLVEAAAFVYLLRYVTGSYRLLLALGGYAYAVKYAVYYAVDDPLVVVASHLVTGVSFAAFHLSAVSLASAIAPDSLKSTAQTVLWSAVFGLGAGVGHLLAGALHDSVGVQSMYLYLAVIAALGGSVALFLDADAGRPERDVTPAR